MISLLGKVKTFGCSTRLTYLRRSFGDIHLPDQENWTAADAEDFNLQDFQEYKESPDVILAKENTLAILEKDTSVLENKQVAVKEIEEYAEAKQPLAMVSQLTDPYLNLAIEDYLFDKMPLPEKKTSLNYNRLFLYANSSCVVIGKNQNPWKEVNLPLLNSLHIPLIRRRSGGGTVVHDLGNLNFAFMTTKSEFDRQKFSSIIRDAVNSSVPEDFKIDLNERGDIVRRLEGIDYKVSGSAYKLSKGKFYHHGTMLLNLRLDILSALLSRDEKKLGIVHSNAIDSVKSQVTNLGLDRQTIIDIITSAFRGTFANSFPSSHSAATKTHPVPEMDKCDSAKALMIDESTSLPDSVYETSDNLKEWAWTYGSTPKFSHEIENEQMGFSITFHIDKEAKIKSYDLHFFTTDSGSQQRIRHSLQFLDQLISKGDMYYTGSSVAGPILDDLVSEWLGHSIDGSI